MRSPRVCVVGGENLLCAPAGRKHKEKFSQAPNMSMVQVLMQQMITGVIRSQSLRSRRRSQHPLLPPLHSLGPRRALCSAWYTNHRTARPSGLETEISEAYESYTATATDATPTASTSHKTTASGSASSALMTVGTTYTTTHATAYEQRLMKMRRVTRQTDTTNTAITDRSSCKLPVSLHPRQSSGTTREAHWSWFGHTTSGLCGTRGDTLVQFQRHLPHRRSTGKRRAEREGPGREGCRR